MSDGDFDAEAYVRAAAAALGIELTEAQLPEVAANLERTAELAALLFEKPLPDDRQPAPVFRP